MALIVFFRGINVGGHRNLRPSLLAKELAAWDVVNIGAAGTFVVRRPGSRTRFLAELRRRLPFEATVAFCDSRELIELEAEHPFGTDEPVPDAVRFLSILSKAAPRNLTLPVSLPEPGEWLVQIIGTRNRLVYGLYRRHMKTIRYLGEIDKLFGAPATTRSWSTVLSILRVVQTGSQLK